MRNLYLLTGMLCILGFNAFSQCSPNNAAACSCAQAGATDCDLLPDIIVGKPPLLVSGSSGIIEYSQSGNGSNNGRLRISVSTPNIGLGPLEILAKPIYVCGTDTFFGTSPGTCPGTGLAPKQLVNQRVFHRNSNTMTYYERPAGTMTYHPGHGHMHVDEWGIYTLRSATQDPNPLNWPIIGTGAKLAFCLMDYGSCSGYAGHCVDSAGNTMLNSNFPNYGLGGGDYNCSPVVQGISSGYTDIYYQYLDGMWINIPPGTCNGNYFIVVHLDPYNYFLESNENNNVLAVPYTLTQQSGSAPVVTAGGPTTFCSGGSVTLNTSAGGSYLWSNGGTTQSINVTTSGSYMVTVTNGACNGVSQPMSVVVNAIPVNITPSSGSVCNGSSAQLSASATTTGFTNQILTFSNNTIIPIPDNLPAGASSPISVSGINPATLSAGTVVSVTLNITHTYDSDLIISLISPSGNSVVLSNRRGGSANNFTNTVFSMTAPTPIGSGSAPFTGTYIPDGNFASFAGNANGTWTLKVVDVAGNDTGTLNSWILKLNNKVTNSINYSWASSPAGFTSNASAPVVTPMVNTTYTVTATDAITGCTGSASVLMNVNPLPGAAVSSNSPVCENTTLSFGLTSAGTGFSWAGPAGFTSTDKEPVLSNVGAAQAGTYTVTATSAQGCTSTGSVIIAVNTAPVISAVAMPVSCYGGNNGLINLSVSNAPAPSFLWSNGSTTEDISGLTNGNHQVTVTSGSCVTGAGYTVNSPSALKATTSKVNITCHGAATGVINTFPSGGVPPYSFLWSNGMTSQSIGGLTSGQYSVTISDGNGCTITKQVQLNQAQVITATASLTSVSCVGAANGKINLTASGGTAPFTYSWSNGSTTEDLSSLSPGAYTVTITDNCGNVKLKTYTVAQKTTPFGLSILKTNILCPGIKTGGASVVVTNGIAPYAYLWNTVPVATTASVSGLGKGSYIVTVTDGSGCTRSMSFYISQPPHITSVITQSNVSSPGGNNGSISLAMSGGTGPYTYSWNTIPVKTTASITGLMAGVYKCNVRDSNQCLKKITVTISQPSAFAPSRAGDVNGSRTWIKAVPNPSTGLVEVSFMAGSQGEGKIRIFDLLGNAVYSLETDHIKGLNTSKLDLRAFTKGVYFVRIDTKEHHHVIKLVLQ